MKDLIIDLNNFLAYVSVLALAVLGFAGWGVVGCIGGFVVGSVVSGVWFLLSGIYDELKRLNATQHPRERKSSTESVNRIMDRN